MINKYKEPLALALYKKATELIATTLSIEAKYISIYYQKEDVQELLFESQAIRTKRLWRNLYHLDHLDSTYSPLAIAIPPKKLDNSTRQATLEKYFLDSVIFALDYLINTISLKVNIFDEFHELLNRITIPKYISTCITTGVPPGHQPTLSKKANYGRIIREIFFWNNNTIEGKPINTGFIVADSINHLRNIPDVTIIKVEPKKVVDLFDYTKVKNLLEIVDGRNSFLIVVPHENDLLVQGICIFPSEILINPFSGKLGFSSPVFSLQDSKVKISRGAQIILEYINGKPKIKRYQYSMFINELFEQIKSTNKNEKRITKIQTKKLAELLMELSLYGKGTSIIFGFDEADSLMRRSVDYNIKICEELPLHWGDNLDKKKESILKLFSDISKTDGAVLINKKMELVGFGAILHPSKKSKGINGGSRHKSMSSYTADKDNLFGIVISSDGPISIMKNGEIQFRL